MPRLFPQFGYNPISGEWNDSLAEDYLWSNVNFGEAIPDIMTPCTWSMMWVYLNVTFPVHIPGAHPVGGNIAGRLYFNLSVISSLNHAMGHDARKERFGDLLGSIPPDLEVPYLPFTALSVIWHVLPGMIQDMALTRRDVHQFPAYLTHLPERRRVLLSDIAQCKNAATLLELWNGSLLPARMRDLRMLRSTTIGLSAPATKFNIDLTALVGDAEASTLLSNLSGPACELESLGPLVGLAKVSNGQMSREEYTERYGHRGPHEAELAAPRPCEDPHWLDQRLADFVHSGVDVEALLARQRAVSSAAWQRFEQRFPEKNPRFPPPAGEGCRSSAHPRTVPLRVNPPDGFDPPVPAAGGNCDGDRGQHLFPDAG